MASVMRSALLAHQGGWDEILLVAGPILAIVGLLMLAKRRVDAATADAPGGDEDGEPGDEPRNETRDEGGHTADAGGDTAAAGDDRRADQPGSRSMSAPTDRKRPTRSS